MKKKDAKIIYELIEIWLKKNRNRIIQDMSVKLKEKYDEFGAGASNDEIQIELRIRRIK